MKKLSRVELKNVMGGDAPTASCTANCANANAVSIDCGANSTCTASDNVGVKCSGANTDYKCCYSIETCYV